MACLAFINLIFMDPCIVYNSRNTKKMQLFNRLYYSKVYWGLNMFRAAHRSSSGDLNCICSLWFIYPCGDRPLSRVSGKFFHLIFHSALTMAGHHMGIQTRGCKYSLELLIMSGVQLETCWALKKFWNNKFYYKVASCCLYLPIHTTMHGSRNIKFTHSYISLCNCRSKEMYTCWTRLGWCCCMGIYSAAPWNGGQIHYHGCSILSSFLWSCENKSKTIHLFFVSVIRTTLLCLFYYPCCCIVTFLCILVVDLLCW